jgi:hypothetical protein
VLHPARAPLGASVRVTATTDDASVREAATTDKAKGIGSPGGHDGPSPKRHGPRGSRVPAAIVSPFRQTEDHVVFRYRPVVPRRDRVSLPAQRSSGFGSLTRSLLTPNGVSWGLGCRRPPGCGRLNPILPSSGRQHGSGP